MTYYDWNKTISFDAPLTMVVTVRNEGKTYGLRKQFYKDWTSRGHRFAHICRTVEELKKAKLNYFDKLMEKGDVDGERYEFAICGFEQRVRLRDAGDGKPGPWEVMGYFVALTQQQMNKETTFAKVKRIVMDEAILDHRDRYHDYLDFEYDKFVNLVSSLTREDPDSPGGIEPRIYLLANACDLFNPYFQAYGIVDEPRYGYSWHAGKTFLLHFKEPSGERDMSDTVVGRLAANSKVTDVFTENRFINSKSDFVAKKTSRAKHVFGIVFMGRGYGIWCDESAGLYYVNEQIPSDSKHVYSLTTDDDAPNYIAAKRSNRVLRQFREFYYLGVLRFSSEAVRADFMRLLDYIGAR